MQSNNNASLMPIYRFEWADGSSRRTDNIDADAHPEAVENLAELGRQDDDCEVVQVGVTN